MIYSASTSRVALFITWQKSDKYVVLYYPVASVNISVFFFLKIMILDYSNPKSYYSIALFQHA